MSTFKLCVVALVLACACFSASASVLYFEDFESYGAGTSLHEINGWEGWYGAAGSAASVSGEQAYDGSKSVVVKGGQMLLWSSILPRVNGYSPHSSIFHPGPAVKLGFICRIRIAMVLLAGPYNGSSR